MQKNDDGWKGLRIRNELHSQLADIIKTPTASDMGIKNITQLVDMTLRKGIEFIQYEMLDHYRRKGIDIIIQQDPNQPEKIEKLENYIKLISNLRETDRNTIQKMVSALKRDKEIIKHYQS